MENTKKIGVWMDYSKASFISHEPLNEHIQTVFSEHDKMPREDGQGADGARWNEHSSNNEYKKDHKEMEQLKRYFDSLEGLLLDYDEILLFGPTKAKNELKNHLADNKKFDSKILHVESSDQMTENQLLAFVRDFYSKQTVK